MLNGKFQKDFTQLLFLSLNKNISKKETSGRPRGTLTDTNNNNNKRKVEKKTFLWHFLYLIQQQREKKKEKGNGELRQ